MLYVEIITLRDGREKLLIVLRVMSIILRILLSITISVNARLAIEKGQEYIVLH